MLGIRITCTLGLLFLVGCESNIYRLELTPQDDHLTRALTCWREVNGVPANKSFPKVDLARIKECYTEKQYVASDRTDSFVGDFPHETPGDIGGSGSFTRFKTVFGTTCFYSERFRGDDDLVKALTTSFAKADQLISFLIGWFHRELGQHEGFPKLLRFCHTNLRQDLKNLFVYISLAESFYEYDDKLGKEMVARFTQFLVDRDYIKLSQIPILCRQYGFYEKDNLSSFPNLLQQFIIKKMAIDPEKGLPSELDFLSAQRIEGSFGAYLKTTKEFKALQTAWTQVSNSKKKKGRPPIPFDVIPSPLNTAIIFNHSDKLEMKLNLSVAPIATNGTWDEQARCVTWKRRSIINVPGPLPTYAYVFWATPSLEGQKQHFGIPVLSGEDLVQYCFWAHSLGPKDAEIWRKFISRLKPEKDLKKMINSFRFPGEVGIKGISKMPRSLLIKNLKKSK